jgi:hypothetical protein
MYRYIMTDDKKFKGFGAGFRARSGKDTACEYLQKKYTGDIIRFAEPVYNIAAKIQEYYGFDIKKDGGLLQVLGEAIRAELGQDIFANVLEKKLNQSKELYHFIPDIRYQNELDMLKRNNILTGKINRKDRPIDRDQKHRSETELENAQFDIELNNNGTLEEFYQLLEDTIQL